MGLSVVIQLMLLVSCVGHITSQQVSTTRIPQRTVTIPPLIIQDPPKVMAFRELESIEMPCVANGEPEPTYKWQMNHKDFDPSGLDGRVAIQPGVGTLIFARPIERDEGIYQCFAQNQVGTAITVMVDLRQAILEPFQPSAIRQHRPMLGHYLTLKCIPPRSFPQPDIFWATISEGSRFTPIDLTNRITIDPEGNLHFAHVLPEDAMEGRTYACIVQNQVMRSIQQGEYAQIFPQGQTVQNMPPSILWQSPTHQVTLRGQTWRVKCIFSGSPTPRVDWVRHDGKDLPPRARFESFGMELVIDYVEFEDAGKYECQGINSEAQVPIRRSFELSIESAPYWVQKPESVDAAENEAAVFHCQAAGIPEPINFWFLNGIPISNVPADPRRVVEKTKLTFYNMTKEDAQVVQCNSTNKHGYIFTNAYLNVLSEPATIVTPPLIDQKAAEGQTINLTCEVFGSPKPLVVWKKSNEQLTGGRFRVLENGNLEISDVSLVDAGSYECIATNVFGTDSAVGSLVVRRKTTIETKPLDVMVYEGTEAKFTCTAATDPEEVAGLTIDWKKDGQFIDYQLAQRVFKNDMDNSLTISGTINLDTGKYTCVARNGLDEDEWAAQLIVQGVPDPPNNVRVLCDKDRQAEVTWQPGRENYAPILNFIIQFNTTFTPDTWIDIETNVSQSDRRKVVNLSPYGNYTFRVLARNKIGMSQPSQHTVDVCRTEPGPPVKNPENVIGEGDLPDNLVIFWTPMPKIEQNAQGFKYIITWKRADQADAVEENWQVDLPEAWHYVVWEKFDKPYIPFYISVKAANAIGEATVSPKTIMGYSGEDIPDIYPTDVVVETGSVKSTEASLTWTPIDEDPDKIRGFFRGYRIQFAKADEWPENIREQDLILNDPLYYPRPRIQRKKRQVDEEEDPIVRVTLMNLPPHSTVRVQVRVLNKYYAGPASEPIEFETDEGVPGPPAMFDVLARGSTHFELQWERPYESNGIIVGYNISYQSITGLNLGRLQYREPIEDAEAVRARLTGLQPDAYYRVYLHAATSRGKGEPIFLDMKTTPAGPPSAPTFDVVGLNDTWVNITWEPSRSGNPGSVFYVQYRPRGDYEWVHSPDEVIRYHMEIFDLNPGTTYQIRVISKNGAGEEAPGEWLEFHTQGVALGRYDLSISMWFYGIWIVLLILIVFLVVFIMLKVKRDKWWQEKEDEIQEQVRQLQAEEAARQLGVFNQYADTGSREYIDPSMSYHSDYHKGGAGLSEDEDDEEDYSEEEEEEYKPAAPQYGAPQPTYDVYGQQAQQQQQQAGYQPNYQVDYQQPAPVQHLDHSQDKPDTFV